MPVSDRTVSRCGLVVIGRNEGDRLRTCLDSILSDDNPVVYVDSGSTDGSVALARGSGAEVVALDMSMPFTAARARNEGFQHLLQLSPGLDYVQFVDGDCEVVAGWLESARVFLDAHRDIAVVCGRLRERYPDRSVYNLLCDMEWDAPVGEAKACGGNAMMRVKAFTAVRGFRPDLIAGEEPELCVRLRAEGWRIWRLGEEMSLHDAAILHFAQWWMREMRGGYAFASGAYLHGAAPERHGVVESLRNWVWGLGVPLLILAAVSGWGYWGFALLAIYPAQVVRLALAGRRAVKDNWLHALFLVIGKFPEMLGQTLFIYHRCLGRQAQIIEYKGSA
jgi:glycosyltransferase involved in cell wall biosynthesis